MNGNGPDGIVNFQGALPTDPLDLPVFEKAQQLALQQQGHGVDLVEEKAAAGSRLDPPRIGPIGAGEGTALVTEELGFD